MISGLYFACFAGLIALQVVWHFQEPGLAAMLAVPLALTLLQWRPGKPRTWIIGAFVSMFYFVYGISELAVNPETFTFALIEVGLTVSLYILLIVEVAHSRRATAK